MWCGSFIRAKGWWPTGAHNNGVLPTCFRVRPNLRWADLAHPTLYEKTEETLLHRPRGTWVLALVQSCRPLCDERRTQVYSPALWTVVHLDMYRSRVTAWALTA